MKNIKIFKIVSVIALITMSLPHLEAMNFNWLYNTPIKKALLIGGGIVTLGGIAYYLSKNSNESHETNCSICEKPQEENIKYPCYKFNNYFGYKHTACFDAIGHIEEQAYDSLCQFIDRSCEIGSNLDLAHQTFLKIVKLKIEKETSQKLTILEYLNTCGEEKLKTLFNTSMQIWIKERLKRMKINPYDFVWDINAETITQNDPISLTETLEHLKKTNSLNEVIQICIECYSNSEEYEQYTTDEQEIITKICGKKIIVHFKDIIENNEDLQTINKHILKIAENRKDIIPWLLNQYYDEKGSTLLHLLFSKYSQNYNLEKSKSYADLIRILVIWGAKISLNDSEQSTLYENLDDYTYREVPYNLLSEKSKEGMHKIFYEILQTCILNNDHIKLKQILHEIGYDTVIKACINHPYYPLLEMAITKKCSSDIILALLRNGALFTLKKENGTSTMDLAKYYYPKDDLCLKYIRKQYLLNAAENFNEDNCIETTWLNYFKENIEPSDFSLMIKESQELYAIHILKPAIKNGWEMITMYSICMNYELIKQTIYASKKSITLKEFALQNNHKNLAQYLELFEKRFLNKD